MTVVDGRGAVVFSGLAPLVVEDAADEGDRVRVVARTPSGPAACPRCGALPTRMRGLGVLAGFTGVLVRDDYSGWAPFDAPPGGVEQCLAHMP